jgi:hypothetical protein
MIFRPSSHMSGLAFCCSISTRTQNLSIAALGVDFRMKGEDRAACYRSNGNGAYLIAPVVSP